MNLTMMMDHQGPDPVSARRVWTCRAPLLIAAALIIAINGWNLARLTCARAPRNPWEASEVVEAYRSLHGMPVYELAPEGHAAHMYGALAPWLQGRIFRWFGPNNVSGRALSVLSALATVALLALALRGDRSPWYFVVAIALFLGVNHRSGQYFAENRPDMPAILFGTTAVLLMALGVERRRFAWTMLGTVSLVIGFFLKQSVLVFAAVPAVVLFTRMRRPSRWEIAHAAAPLIAMGVVVAGLKVFQPVIYHYMIEVPGAYNILWARVPKYGWELFLDSPLFLVLLGDWIITGRASFHDRPRLAWLAAFLLVTVPFCVVAHAKIGGWENNLLPAFLAMAGLAALLLPRALARLDDPSRPLRARLAFSSFLAVLMLMTAFPHLTRERNILVAAPLWDEGYRETIDRARELAGTVVCPEDPTVPLYAQGNVALNLFTEKDAQPDHGNWPTAVPGRTIEEIRKADYVVDVLDYWGDNLTGAMLRPLGFEPLDDGPSTLGRYRIWKRAGPDRVGWSRPRAEVQNR